MTDGPWLPDRPRYSHATQRGVESAGGEVRGDFMGSATALAQRANNIPLEAAENGGDMMLDAIRRSTAWYTDAPNPNEGSLAAVSRNLTGALGLISAPAQIIDAGIAGFASTFTPAGFGLPAATLFAPQLTLPHAHTHPPSFVPPAPPVPLPSLGTVMLPGAVSVFIGGLPAARTGDVGMSLTCGSLAPPFEIKTGSASVFIGGSRAARMGDFVTHDRPEAPKAGAIAMGAISAAVGLVAAAAAGGAGQSLAAALMAAQAAADAAAIGLQALVGKDAGVPPPVVANLLIGYPTVLIGGFPMPAMGSVITGFTGKMIKRLAQRVARTRLARAVNNRIQRAGKRAVVRVLQSHLRRQDARNRRNQPVRRVGERPSPASPLAGTSLKTFGIRTQALLAGSATFRRQRAGLANRGWTIRDSEAGDPPGSFCSRESRQIVIARGMTPEQEAQIIAHEAGHADYGHPGERWRDGMTRDEYIRENTDVDMHDEGYAQFNACRVRQDILASGGPDIGTPGRNDYAGTYDRYARGEISRDQAVTEMGDTMRTETQSTTNRPYEQEISAGHARRYDQLMRGQP